jgi:GMP synthase (glutamine-hydrolysing)
MILVIDLSYRPGSLSADEFVAPVERIVRLEGHPALIRHYTEATRQDLASADGVILCGTALADSGYLDRLEFFAWLPPFPHPVLGICAGMQVIARLFGGGLSPVVGIGMGSMEVVAPDPLLAGRDRFEAYELHSLAVVPPPTFLILAVSPSGAWNPKDGGPGTLQSGRPETRQGRGSPTCEGRGVQVIRHRDRPVYGVMFHPEVRNEWLVRGFLTLCRPGGRPMDALMEGGINPYQGEREE